MLARHAKAYSSSCLQIAYLQPFHRNSLLKCAAQPKIAKKNNIKNLIFLEFRVFQSSILAFNVIQGIEFCGNREPVYDFLLVINRPLLR